MSYQNGKIYKIVSDKTDKVYIGSTIDPLSWRISKHKCDLKRWKDGQRAYTSSFDIMQYGDFQIVLLELFPCRNKDELREQEQVWIDKTPQHINKFGAFRSNKIVFVNGYRTGRVYKIISKIPIKFILDLPRKSYMKD